MLSFPPRCSLEITFFYRNKYSICIDTVILLIVYATVALGNALHSQRKKKSYAEHRCLKLMLGEELATGPGSDSPESCCRLSA